jgi:hypothetical protein
MKAMTTDELAEILKKYPGRKVYVACGGYHSGKVQFDIAKERQYNGKPVKDPGAFVITDGCAVEQLGIY